MQSSPLSPPRGPRSDARTATWPQTPATRLAALERLGQPQNQRLSFLAGPDGSWVNGQVLRVDGGIV